MSTTESNKKSNNNDDDDEDIEKKQIEKYKRQKEISRARKARARDRASNRIVTTNFNDVLPEDQAKAAANAMKHHLSPPPPVTTNMVGDGNTTPKEKEMVANELAELREMKLTNKFYKQFSSVIESISKERAVSEAALSEFERKKAENAAYYAARGETTPPATLTTMEKISVELRKRNEIIRKKEAHTKQLYHRYTKAKKGMITGMDVNDLELPPLPDDIIRQMDLFSKNEQEQLSHVTNSQRKTKVAETLRQYEAPPTPPPTDNAPTNSKRRNKIPRGNWVPTPILRSPSRLSLCNSIAEEEDEVLNNARAKAEDADQDAAMEESELQATLAETNAIQLKKAMAWLNENKMMSTATATGTTSTTASMTMSFDNLSEIGDSVMGDDDDDSFMAKSLAAFLIQEAGQNINEEDYAMSINEEEISCTSQSLHDDKSAVLAAEKAAKDMADALSFTSSITADTALKPKHKQSQSSPPAEEKWYAYWSKEHQREYYYEPISQKVTWSAPDSYSVTSSFRANDTTTTAPSNKKTSTNDDNVSVVSYSSHTSMQSINTRASDTRSLTQHQYSSRDFTPSMADSTSTNMTRSKTLRLRTIALRKSRKKRMIRRTLWSIVTLIALATTGGYYAYQNNMLFDTTQRQHVAFLFDGIHDNIEFLQYHISYTFGISTTNTTTPQTSLKEQQINEVKTKVSKQPKKKINPPSPSPKISNTNTSPKQKQQIFSTKNKKPDETKNKSNVINSNLPTQKTTSSSKLPPTTTIQESNKDIALSTATVTTATVTTATVTTTTKTEEHDINKNELAIKKEEKLSIILKNTRPKRCNIPFAYIFSRNCRVLAKAKPVYNLKDFVNSMMQ